MSGYTIQCSTCGAPDMMLCDCGLPEAPAPLDEARLALLVDEIRYAENENSSTGPFKHTRGKATELLSRAISEARAEQIERDARIVEDLVGASESMLEAAAAIRSQDNPHKQGE